MSLEDHVIQATLKEDGASIELPVRKNGELEPHIVARYHIQGMRPLRGNSHNLLYAALPQGTHIEVEPAPFNVVFAGDSSRVQTFKFGPTETTLPGFALLKIHPDSHYKILAPDGAEYHTFEVLNTPATGEQYVDFAPAPRDIGAYLVERPDKIVSFPGGMIFPNIAAYRLPGWPAKEFNGSPELGFAYSRFTEPRTGEKLHSHRTIMEPYFGREGEIPLFIVHPDGEERLPFNVQVSAHHDTEGMPPNQTSLEQRWYRGDTVRLRPGDIALPLHDVAHIIDFTQATFPCTMFCLNYAALPLNEIPKSDTVEQGRPLGA